MTGDSVQIACCTPCQYQYLGSTPSQRLLVVLTSYGTPLGVMASSVAMSRTPSSRNAYITSGVVSVMSSSSAAHSIKTGSSFCPRNMALFGSLGCGGSLASSSTARSAGVMNECSPCTAAAADAEILGSPCSSDHLTASHCSLPCSGLIT